MVSCFFFTDLQSKANLRLSSLQQQLIMKCWENEEILLLNHLSAHLLELRLSFVDCKK